MIVKQAIDYLLQMPQSAELVFLDRDIPYPISTVKQAEFAGVTVVELSGSLLMAQPAEATPLQPKPVEQPTVKAPEPKKKRHIAKHHMAK